jgi:DNA repair protein RecN (Recombination protein N)
MLKSLRIKNYALVGHLEAEFKPGLNIISGATGAGKSIIVGAVNLILGERASSEAVRTGFDKASIEGEFKLQDDPALKGLLAKLGMIPQDDVLIIRREISSRGQSKCFLDDRLVTLGSLKSIGDRLADLHGQHEHQSLLNVERHLEYLDSYADLGGIIERVGQAFHLLKNKRRYLEDLQSSKSRDEERSRLYEFQIQEIDTANLTPDEEETLKGQRKVLENAESLFEISSNLYQQLYEGEASILERLGSMSRELTKTTGVDSRLKEPSETLESSLIALQDAARFLEDYKTHLEFDPQKLEMIRERVNLLNTLKRKYDKSVEEILAYRDQMQGELERIESKDQSISNLEQEIVGLSETLAQGCCLLSQKRKTKASQLSRKIQKALSDLGMPKTRFEIKVSQREDENGVLEIDGKRYFIDEKGMDQVEFFVSPNPGEDLKPLAKIASGGEISRIMLALKSILAKVDRLETVIFDEIDVGIGGEVASVVGRSLKDLASSHQVIVITHLQQIASQADHHFNVFKESAKGRTVTRIRILDRDERVKEIARMISGEKVSPVTLKQAKEMITPTDHSSVD